MRTAVGVWPGYWPCSSLESVRRWECWRVYKAVANIIVPMFLASSHPHNDISIKGLGPQIPVWPMDLSSHLCVSLDTTVDGWVVVRRGRVIIVVGHVGCRLALAGQSPSHERVALLAFM